MELTAFYKTGEIIIKEGEQGKNFYILKEGSVNVSKKGLVVAVIDEPNTIFGEMSDILKGPRTCTITARTDSSIIHVPKNIDGVIDRYPSITKKLIIMLAKRLRDTTKEMLIFDLDHNDKTEMLSELCEEKEEQKEPRHVQSM